MFQLWYNKCGRKTRYLATLETVAFAYMAYKRLGEREWGISPSGERIYVVGYCKCKSKVLLCESEFKEMLNNISWMIERPTIKSIFQKSIRIPKIKVEWSKVGD